MSMPPPPPSLAHVMVVSPLYCATYPVNLTIVRKVTCTTIGHEVTDHSDNIVFKVRVPAWRYRLILLDAAGNPLLTLRPKIGSRRSRWKAYRGESTDEKDLLFSVKRSSLFQFRKTKLHVFLANNTREDCCDFRVEASSHLKSCIIYAGDSNSVVAQVALFVPNYDRIPTETLQMQKKYKFFGKDRFMVSVSPNVDAAFVTAITVILDAINSSRRAM